ncbi:MAG: hypothetical protein PHP69_06715 [Candidatus Omnitrophica bacterium]|nr:hypothetical protein [Candidatus Omnitrophota bacterium]MDD5081699.1 hypothetical protein [Candidatus Omnitrophota bacterium]
MKRLLVLSVILIITGCGKTIVTEEKLESFFRKHKVGSDYPVALKKRSIAESYLATIHGYPDNLSVCRQVIEPYNKDTKLSAVEGGYYCEVLR